MPAFLKQRYCASSEFLAASKRLSPLLSEEASRHLNFCEFCSTELGFLKKAAPDDDHPAPIEIPLALRLFASNILAKLQIPEERDRAV